MIVLLLFDVSQNSSVQLPFYSSYYWKYDKSKNSAKYHKILMSRFWEIGFCVSLLFRRHVCLSNLKEAPSRKLPLTARKTVFSHLKEKAIWEEKTLMLWILLGRNASTNTISFYHNSREMKFMLSTQGASRADFFFNPLNVREFFFFGPRSYAGLFSVYMYNFFLKSTSPSPHPHPQAPLPPATEMVRPTNRGISHVSYFLCHATCAPRSSYWLKIQAQWAMRFSDISGHRKIRIQSLFIFGHYRDYE